jgi:hypothetical protein
MNYSFQKWRTYREWADFGFEKDKDTSVPEKNDDKPLNPLDVEYVSQLLKRRKIGVKESKLCYFGEIQWGEGPGAIKLEFSPLGGLRVRILKQIPNLIGESMWICKKVIVIKNFYDEHPDTLIENLSGFLTEVDSQQLDTPSNTYDGLENLVLNMASSLLRHTTQKIFIYEGIRRLKENEDYIIHFGVTGMGVQRQDQKRLDQFAVQVTYNKKEGIIRVGGNELGSHIKNHKWEYDPSEFLEYFMPNQDYKEIIGSTLAHFNSY